MRRHITLKLSNFITINPKFLHLSGPCKISYPLYFTNNEQLGNNKHTASIKTLENGVAHHVKTFKFYKNNPKRLHLSNPPKISYPLYLTNNEQLEKNKHTKRFKTLKNGEYITSKTKKKKLKFGGDTH
jgi:hypothetical protein